MRREQKRVMERERERESIIRMRVVQKLFVLLCLLFKKVSP